MPPKKPASQKGKGKPAPKKGKGGKEKPKKLTKKQQKILKKYGSIMVDGNYITSMRRDELEASAEKLREEVTLQRSERIRYQLERDFLYDLVSLYLARHRELQLRIDAQTADNNRLLQDTEEMGIVKGEEAKHFRYECMLRRARMDMSDEMRRKQLVAHADRIWQNSCASIDEQLDLQERREDEFAVKMVETKEELNDLDAHLSQMKEDMRKFAQDCTAKVAQSIKDCAMITKMDSLEGEEIMNEMLFSSCVLNDQMFDMIQNYYNDMTSNNLNVIITMRDRYEELFDHNKFMRGEIERYEDGSYRANKTMKKLKPTYLRTKNKYDQTLRLEQGNLTTLKGIEVCESRMEKLKIRHEHLIKTLASIADERAYFRNHANELATSVMDSYNKRYHVQQRQKEMEQAVNSRSREEQNLLNYFDDPSDYFNEVEGYRAELNQKDHALDRYMRKLTLHQWEVAERKY